VLSFIVPAYNEELELPDTLKWIRQAAAGNDHEILVVDDASIDATAKIATAAGVKLISIQRRQIAAARNAGALHAHGDLLFFVDADTHINSAHVSGAIDAVVNGYAGGSARVDIAGEIPTWSRIFFNIFCTIYFGLKLGAGAFLFTTRSNFDAVGGFSEEFFVGEEVYFSLAVRKLGRFTILTEPVLTSGRKLRMYSAREILGNMLRVLLRGPRAARSRDGFEIWYDGRREKTSAYANSPRRDQSISTP
jgi:glycosyltransferase involved in cell wall biosynthesis